MTATNAFVTAPIARRFGVEHLIATVPAQEDGRFTGGVRGEPCFREGKVRHATAWLESLGACWQGFASSTFYSDSRNDIALLEHVTVPVATNPDATFARMRPRAAGVISRSSMIRKLINRIFGRRRAVAAPNPA